MLCEGIQTEVLAASKIKNEKDEVVQYSKEIADNVAAFAMDLPPDLSMAFLLVVSGPEATAMMDVLDANTDIHEYVKKMLDTGKFKAAQ